MNDSGPLNVSPFPLVNSSLLRCCKLVRDFDISPSFKKHRLWIDLATEKVRGATSPHIQFFLWAFGTLKNPSLCELICELATSKSTLAWWHKCCKCCPVKQYLLLFRSYSNKKKKIILAQLFAAQVEIVVSMRQISVTLRGLRRVRPEQKCDLNRIKQADKPSLNSLSASQVDVSEVKTAAQIVTPQTISTVRRKKKKLATKAQDVLRTHASRCEARLAQACRSWSTPNPPNRHTPKQKTDEMLEKIWHKQ